MYSTSDEPNEISAEKSMGAVDFITKPTRFEVLCHLLAEKLALHTK